MGKEKAIQWGEGPGVSAQSIRPAGKENRAFGILEDKTLRNPKAQQSAPWECLPVSSTFDSAPLLCHPE